MSHRYLSRNTLGRQDGFIANVCGRGNWEVEGMKPMSRFESVEA